MRKCMALYILIFLSLNVGECFWYVIITHGFWNVSNRYSALMLASLFVDTWAICVVRSFRKVLAFIQEWVEKHCMYIIYVQSCFQLSFKRKNLPIVFCPTITHVLLKDFASFKTLSSALKKNKRLAWILKNLEASWVQPPGYLYGCALRW